MNTEIRQPLEFDLPLHHCYFCKYQITSVQVTDVCDWLGSIKTAKYKNKPGHCPGAFTDIEICAFRNCTLEGTSQLVNFIDLCPTLTLFSVDWYL